jgi:glycosyltransferase involved in cell wall biosynthesis
MDINSTTEKEFNMKPLLNKDGNPLRILMISSHHCIRVIKETIALQKMGYKVDGLANRSISWGTDLHDTFGIWLNERQFKNYIADNKERYDILHFSNEPDAPVKWIKEVVGDSIPLIVDLHDLDSIRREIIPIPEREMFNYGDAFIYASQPIQEKTNKLHAVTKPNIVLYSYCTDGMISYDPKDIPNRKGLLYEGGANPPEDNEMNRVFSYRSLYDIIKKLVEMGNETYMFCGNVSAFETYQNTGAVLYPPTMYNDMMNEMIKYKYGILIFNNEDGKKDQVNYTLTNKMMEYLHCGMPSLTCWCPESEKYVNKHKIGFVFNHISEIENCSQLESQYNEIMDNIWEAKKNLIMENFIWKVENLMADLLHLKRKPISDKVKKLNIFEYGKDDVESLLPK